MDSTSDLGTTVEGSSLAQQASFHAAAERFLGSVPNFILADWDNIAAPEPLSSNGEAGQPRERRSITDGLWWVFRLSIIVRRSSFFVVPDILLAEYVWGARQYWPANWRTQLRNFVRPKVKGQNRPRLPRTCEKLCPLYGLDAPRHAHLRMDLDDIFGIKKLLGWLTVFEVSHNKDTNERTYDFARPTGATDRDTQEKKKLIKDLKKHGRLAAVYLPVLVFGPSPRSGLKQAQCNILTALTHEITRTSRRDREDRALVYVPGQLADLVMQAISPALNFTEPFIGFNGNGGYQHRNLRGHGYHLVGKNWGGWLSKAGYAIPEDADQRWMEVRHFLNDLLGLCEPFALVGGAWHGGKGQWLPLAELPAMTRTKADRAFLDASVLRVYTAGDYLVRWRGYFAQKLGFSSIPGDFNELAVVAKPVDDDGIHSAAELGRWMRREGITDQLLANRLGTSRSWVSQQRSGRKPWSLAFADQLTVVIENWNGDQQNRNPS